jgi:hypothetical protein
MMFVIHYRFEDLHIYLDLTRGSCNYIGPLVGIEPAALRSLWTVQKVYWCNRSLEIYNKDMAAMILEENTLQIQ